MGLSSETLISLPELTEADWDLIYTLTFSGMDVEYSAPLTRGQWSAVVDMALGLALREEAHIRCCPDRTPAIGEPTPQQFRELAVKLIRGLNLVGPAEYQEQICNDLLNQR